MAEPRTPEFAEPGTYVRYFGENLLDSKDEVKKFRYLQLQERDGPLRYPFTFTSTAVDALTSQQIFSDLDPGRKHVYQAFLGVAPGVRVRVSHPFDVRILRWDQNVAQISDDQTAVLTHGLSPYEAPSYSLWIPPNKRYPALTGQNATADLVMGGKAIKPRVIWIGSVFNYLIVDEAMPDILDKLVKKKVPSLPITFGGSIRDIPR